MSDYVPPPKVVHKIQQDAIRQDVHDQLYIINHELMRAKSFPVVHTIAAIRVEDTKSAIVSASLVVARLEKAGYHVGVTFKTYKFFNWFDIELEITPQEEWNEKDSNVKPQTSQDGPQVRSARA